MKKWCRKAENRILVTMLAFLCLFSQFSTNVNASTELVNTPFTFSYIFPRVYGGLDETVIIPLNYEQRITVPTLETDYYYLIYFRQPYYVNADFEYVVSDENYVNSEMYIKYGGEKHYFNNQFCSFVTTGVDSSILSIGVDLEVNLTPYWASDGYIYQNNCQVEFYTADSSYSAYYKILRLESSEVAETKQLVYILEYLSNSPDINGEHSSSIILKLTDIMNDTASIKGILSSLYNLLVEVYGQDEADKVVMDSFQENSSSQSSELGQLNQESQVEKIDIDSASSTVDTNIDMTAIGNSGVILSALTGENKILVMMLGVSAIALVAYVFFGKR